MPGIGFGAGRAALAAAPRSSAKIAAACVSAANSTPSGPNVSGPIDLNAGPVAAARRSAAGTPDQDTSTVRTNADFRISRPHVQ